MSITTTCQHRSTMNNTSDTTPTATISANPDEIMRLAADAARHGKPDRCQDLISAAAGAWAPREPPDDPAWARITRNAFRLGAWILIDDGIEQEALTLP